MKISFHAYVASALFDLNGAVFALGDGSVRFDTGEVVQAHEGAVLCAALHPGGEGIVTGGDDGRLVWSRKSGAAELCDIGGKWIDAVAASSESGLIALAAGRELIVRDVKDAAFERRFRHERSVADVAFDPKGRKIAVASYGGVWLWFARIAEQKPQILKWPGAHTGVTFSPDGKFVLSAMQENALHGWRTSDAKDMRMAGYPGKIRSMVFIAKGALMATSGGPGVVFWPFAGANGPMGREAVEIDVDESALVVRCAGTASLPRLTWGRADGRVFSANLDVTGVHTIKAEKGAQITALAMSPDGGKVAYGDEDGEAGVVTLP